MVCKKLNLVRGTSTWHIARLIFGIFFLSYRQLIRIKFNHDMLVKKKNNFTISYVLSKHVLISFFFLLKTCFNFNMFDSNFHLFFFQKNYIFFRFCNYSSIFFVKVLWQRNAWRTRSWSPFIKTKEQSHKICLFGSTI